MTDAPTTADLLTVARAVATAAGEAAMPHFRRSGLSVDDKADGSPVTIADRQAEQAMRRVIGERFPGDAVLGEEFGAQNNERLVLGHDAPRQWVLDPIDGTASFIRGVPLFGALVAVMERGRPVVGVMHFPALDETVYASVGGGAWFCAGIAPPVRAEVSATSSLAQATVCTTSDDYFRQTESRSVWRAICDASASTRGWSDCYAFALLATGQIDAVVEPPVLHPWDAAAAIPIIAEAGGRWTDWEGVCSVERRSVLATNAAIHDELLHLIGKTPAGDD